MSEFSLDIEALTEEELNLLLANVESVSNDADRMYIPHPAQLEFHTVDNKIRALFGANRSGKTDAGVNEARMHSTGQYPDWYPMALRLSGPNMGRIVVTDYKKGAGEVLEPKLKRWFDPADIIKIDRSVGNISKVYVRHITGGVSTFDVMTHEQDTNTFEGWSGHWAWFDEPPPRDKYIATLRGLVDFNGRLWITATPISEPWLFDEIVLNTARKAWHKAVSIYENPHLTKKGIEELAVSLTPEEKEARIHGKFLHLTGRVYKDLDTNVHLIKKLPKGSEHWPTYFVLDPADRRPHHGIWAKIDPMDNLYIIQEFVFKGTIKSTSEQILIREKVWGINPEVVIRVLDPNKGRTPSNVTGLKLVEEFATHGVYFTTNVNDDIALGHLSVTERLLWNKDKPISTENSPKLWFVEESTRETIRQMLSYVWEDWRGRNSANRSQKEKPQDINKDLPDCIRYLCMSRPVWHDPYARSGNSSTGKHSFTGWGDS